MPYMVFNDLYLPIVYDENMKQHYLDGSKVLQICNKSCSRPNFAAKLSSVLRSKFTLMSKGSYRKKEAGLKKNQLH